MEREKLDGLIARIALAISIVDMVVIIYIYGLLREFGLLP